MTLLVRLITCRQRVASIRRTYDCYLSHRRLLPLPPNVYAVMWRFVGHSGRMPSAVRGVVRADKPLLTIWKDSHARMCRRSTLGTVVANTDYRASRCMAVYLTHVGLLPRSRVGRFSTDCIRKLALTDKGIRKRGHGPRLREYQIL